VNAWIAALRIGLAAILRARLRSFLTTLGILIGIAAVVLVTALGAGARQSIGSQIDSLGANVIYVFSRPASHSGFRGGGAALLGLSDQDADAIRREIPLADKVTVFSEVDGPVVSEFSNERTKIIGADINYLEVRGFALSAGRNFSAEEIQSKAKVTMVAATAARKLFGAEDPIGRYLRIGRHPYRVIATLGPKGASPFGVDQAPGVLGSRRRPVRECSSSWRRSLRRRTARWCRSRFNVCSNKCTTSRKGKSPTFVWVPRNSFVKCRSRSTASSRGS
jgi:putative ABC transport system permease protein